LASCGAFVIGAIGGAVGGAIVGPRLGSSPKPVEPAPMVPARATSELEGDLLTRAWKQVLNPRYSRLS
jgi:hypothetical protein